MRRWIGVLAGLLLCSVAHAEIINVTPAASGGGGGSFPPTGCVTANGVIFNNATPCDSGFTYAGSGGAVTISGTLAIGAGSAITSSGAGGALGTNAFTSTAYAPLASPTFTGVVTTAVGSAATPSLAVGNSTTGLYSVSTIGFGISVNGTDRINYGISAGTSMTVTAAITSLSGRLDVLNANVNLSSSFLSVFNTGQMVSTNGGCYVWSSSTSLPGTVDTTICRKSAGVVEIASGTGAGNNGSFDTGAYLVGGTAGASCTLTVVAHLTVVNGIVTLCN